MIMLAKIITFSKIFLETLLSVVPSIMFNQYFQTEFPASKLLKVGSKDSEDYISHSQPETSARLISLARVIECQYALEKRDTISPAEL